MMPNPPCVSVLLTVYNGLPYLRQAIESVLQQTFQDFELVIVDDASTDGSVDCVRSYQDPRIRLVINERNLGQARSLNKGLALARGRYVARLDQDDVCLPERLGRQVTFLDERPHVAVAGTWLYRINEAGRKNGVLGLRVNDRGTCLGILLSQATPVGHPTAMFRREIIESLGGYDETFAPCEDYELWCRVALTHHHIAVIPQPLLMFRVHERQQSIMKLRLQREQFKRAHEQLVGRLARHKQQELGGLLREEAAFWDQHRTPREVQAVIEELAQTLLAIQREFGLSGRERTNVYRRLHWWLGRGALVAILRQHRQSLPAYRFSLRGGVRALGCVATFLYPMCYVASPVFTPRVRETLMRWAWVLSQRRYTLRLLSTACGMLAARWLGAARRLLAGTRL